MKKYIIATIVALLIGMPIIIGITEDPKGLLFIKSHGVVKGDIYLWGWYGFLALAGLFCWILFRFPAIEIEEKEEKKTKNPFD